MFLGDGGNDVSMIQAGDVGIGLVGKVHVKIIYPFGLVSVFYILFTVVTIRAAN